MAAPDFLYILLSMTSTILSAAVALLVGLGIGYSLPGKPAAVSHDMSGTMTSMTASLEGKTGDEFDRAFIEEMIVHHEGAVAMAQLALEKANHAEIKTMANDIISAQTREIETMRDWLQSWYGMYH